jgi:AraC-type DNA-binding domain-containing proteins
MNTQQKLIEAARLYARENANADGLAVTPVPGLRMMCVDSPRGKLHSVYRPLVCLILQGAKQLLVGRQEQLCLAGQSVTVSADMPVTGQVVQASPAKPYIAVAVELDIALLRELTAGLNELPSSDISRYQTLFLQDTDEAILDCCIRLMRLIGRPDAMPVLLPGLMKELHYWLLTGPHGQQLRAMTAADSHLSRLSRALAILRSEYQRRIAIEYLARAASMSLTAFHKHFKDLTSLTPGQYQKRLRLIEARRLMLYQGLSASTAAYEVGYESVSQFNRDYRRMFGAPPRRDVQAAGVEHI